MAESTITVEEKFISRSRATGDNPVIVVSYHIYETDSDAAAEIALQSNVPAVVDGWPLKGCRVDQLGLSTRWEGTATYGPPKGGAGEARGDDVVFQFSTAGGTTHITQSLRTINRFGFNYPDEGLVTAAPDFAGAIGVTERDVEGTDIVSSRYEWSEGHFFAPEVVDSAFRGRLFDLTGTVNDRAFGDLQAGEGLFLGVDGQRRNGPNGPDWELVYRFAASPNATAANQRLKIEYGQGQSVVVVKEGWDYFWIRYRDALDPSNASVVKRPAAAYVERVYRRANWGHATLGLGIASTAYVPPPFAPGGLLADTGPTST